MCLICLDRSGQDTRAMQRGDLLLWPPCKLKVPGVLRKKWDRKRCALSMCSWRTYMFKKCCLNCKNKQPWSVPQGGCRWWRGRRNLKTKSKDHVLTYLANDHQSALAMPRVLCVQKIVNAKAMTTHLEKKQKVVKNTKKRRPKCTSSPSPLKRQCSVDYMTEWN